MVQGGALWSGVAGKEFKSAGPVTAGRFGAEDMIGMALPGFIQGLVSHLQIFERRL